MPASSKTKVFNSISEAQGFLKKGSAVCIGNYDGFHFGHQSILYNLIDKANKLKLKSVLLTFDPHPVKILAPDVAPKLIFTRKQKIEILSKLNLDCVVFQKFDKTFAKITPKNFFYNSIIQALNTKFLSVGYDFTFGKKRTGTTETLETLAGQNNITLEIIKAKMLNNTLVSSSVIRKLIKEGNIALSNKLLTRPYYIDGHIIHGQNRGTALGIHTANLETQNKLIPKDGVYATQIRVGQKKYQSVTNIGYNPTFDNQKRSIETHILNFDSDIYSKEVRLFFALKLRGEIKFATPSALVKQIEKDIEKAKHALEKSGVK